MLHLPTANRLSKPITQSRCINQVSEVSCELQDLLKKTKNIVVPRKTNIEKGNEKVANESVPKKSYKSSFKVLTEGSARYNEFNIQMVSKVMRDHLFGKHVKCGPENVQELNRTTIELKKHGLMSTIKEVPEVNLNLPQLQGETIEDHFYNIGEVQCASYRQLLAGLLTELPDMPKSWELKEGWTKYTADGITVVDFPEEDALLFDVEVCCSEGQMPTLATAVSNKAWYSWVSSNLIKRSDKSPKNYCISDQFIPLESKKDQKGFSLSEQFKTPRIVIGHNVSYDRARVKEQYWLERTALRFLDTMSLHIAVSGVTSYQKNLLKAGLGEDDEWSKLSSLNSLSNVHKLYCGSELLKEERNIFVSGTISDVLRNFQSLMTYCANDVIATHSVFCKLFPMYMSRFPHPVSLAGILELGLAYLPINSNWNQYIENCNDTYNDLDSEAKQILSQLADNACHLMHNEAYKNHLWLWDQDWTTKKLTLNKQILRKKKTDKECVNNTEIESDKNIIDDKNLTYGHNELFEEKLKYLYNMSSLIPARPPHLPGYPAWYAKMCLKGSHSKWSPGPQLISTGMQVVPKLLSLTWKSMPLHYVRGHGWGMLVPYKTDIELNNTDSVPLEKLMNYCENVESELFCGCKKVLEEVNCQVKYICDKTRLKKPVIEDGDPVFCLAEMGTGCGLIKLPHKDGKGLNVGNPLARDYIHKFSENGLGSGNIKTEKLIKISRMLSYWRNNRERIENQLSVWLPEKDIPSFMRNHKDIGVILPQVIVCGTLTRRAVEPTWMTASNALGDRVGSELRSMISAPPNYYLVGADVDSQELWIASIIGDAFKNKKHGCTPFGWMTLSGDKSDGTDMHSVTAKAIGISRNHAKVINYARIYGAGQLFAEHLLKQFNPKMSPSEAKQKASKMFSMTKGKRIYKLKDGVLPDIKKRGFTKYEAKKFCLLHMKDVDELFESPEWIGGTESAMFNRLEEIASSPEPKTPFLKGRLSRALEPGTDKEDKFIPTRINWVVQSGAVDFLHLMLVCMRWLMGPDIRFCLSFHDEVRYLVPKGLRYQTALALHITNLYTRAFCISQLGMSDVPHSIAFFSSVDVDTVLRKESHQDSITPSNPFGLSKGYGVPFGESLSINEALEKAHGIVGQPLIYCKKNKTKKVQKIKK